MATYRVYFIDGLPNVKMLEAESVDAVISYMGTKSRRSRS